MTIDGEEGSVRSGDGAVSGRMCGSGNGCGRPLLVCIHGGGSNSRYFELNGRSVATMAAERGLSVLLVDRPGHGGNPLPAGPDPIARSIPGIRRFIDEVRIREGLEDAGILVIGHSIGGAVALQLAADRRAWPLLGIAVSGIGDRSPAEIRAMRLPSDAPRFVPPSAFAEALFHDPGRALDWRALASLRLATEPWLTQEIVEIVDRWPPLWPTVAREIDVPVHLRLAEHDRIWETGRAVVNRMVTAMERAPRIDGDLLLNGGHLYEACKGGRALIASQLDYLLDCAGGRGG